MFTLNTLEYEINSLEPYMSSQTIEFHHGKHHQAYLDNLNKFIKDTDMENMSLDEIILKSYQVAGQESIFNNAAQVYNHNLFWKVLISSSKNSLSDISPDFKEAICDKYESIDNMLVEFKKIALSQFGSGWTWLVLSDGKLEIVKTSNANTPLVNGKKPLLCIDVWEHSYYLDYQNKRAQYLDNILDNIVNWKYISELFAQYK